MHDPEPRRAVRFERPMPNTSYAVWSLAAVAVLAALYLARVVVVPIVAAAVLAVIVSPVARFLMRRLRFPNGVAAFSAFVFAGVAIVSLMLVAVPTVRRLGNDFPTLLGRIEERLGSIAPSIAALKRWSDTVEKAASLGTVDGTEEVRVRDGGGAVQQMISATPEVVAQIVFMLVLVFFFVRERRILRRGLIGLASTTQDRLRTSRVCRAVQRNVASYLLSVSMINVVLGIATAIAFTFAGMPEPIVWGAAMAILNFVPIIGPLILQVIAFLAGLVVYPTFQLALIPPALLIGLNLVESNFGLPMVMQRRFQISPLTTLIAIAFGAFLWGTAGAILAVPMVMMAITATKAWFAR